jgi:hypothetical protein
MEEKPNISGTEEQPSSSNIAELQKKLTTTTHLTDGLKKKPAKKELSEDDKKKLNFIQCSLIELRETEKTLSRKAGYAIKMLESKRNDIKSTLNEHEIELLNEAIFQYEILSMEETDPFSFIKFTEDHNPAPSQYLLRIFYQIEDTIHKNVTREDSALFMRISSCAWFTTNAEHLNRLPGKIFKDKNDPDKATMEHYFIVPLQRYPILTIFWKDYLENLNKICSSEDAAIISIATNVLTIFRQITSTINTITPLTKKTYNPYSQESKSIFDAVITRITRFTNLFGGEDKKEEKTDLSDSTIEDKEKKHDYDRDALITALAPKPKTIPLAYAALKQKQESQGLTQNLTEAFKTRSTQPKSEQDDTPSISAAPAPVQILPPVEPMQITPNIPVSFPGKYPQTKASQTAPPVRRTQTVQPKSGNLTLPSRTPPKTENARALPPTPPPTSQRTLPTPPVKQSPTPAAEITSTKNTSSTKTLLALNIQEPLIPKTDEEPSQSAKKKFFEGLITQNITPPLNTSKPLTTPRTTSTTDKTHTFATATSYTPQKFKLQTVGLVPTKAEILLKGALVVKTITNNLYSQWAGSNDQANKEKTRTPLQLTFDRSLLNIKVNAKSMLEKEGVDLRKDEIFSQVAGKEFDAQGYMIATFETINEFKIFLSKYGVINKEDAKKLDELYIQLQPNEKKEEKESYKSRYF